MGKMVDAMIKILSKVCSMQTICKVYVIKMVGVVMHSLCTVSMNVTIPQIPGGDRYKVQVSVVEEVVKVNITDRVLEEGLGNEEVSHMSMQNSSVF